MIGLAGLLQRETVSRPAKKLKSRLTTFGRAGGLSLIRHQFQRISRYRHNPWRILGESRKRQPAPHD
jgi:hypothetical protein